MSGLVLGQVGPSGSSSHLATCACVLEITEWEFPLCVITRAWDHSPGDQLLPVQLLGTV